LYLLVITVVDTSSPLDAFVKESLVATTEIETSTIAEAETECSALVVKADISTAVVEADTSAAVVELESSVAVVDAGSSATVAKLESLVAVVEAETSAAVVEVENLVAIVEANSSPQHTVVRPSHKYHYIHDKIKRRLQDSI